MINEKNILLYGDAGSTTKHSRSRYVSCVRIMNRIFRFIFIDWGQWLYALTLFAWSPIYLKLGIKDSVAPAITCKSNIDRFKITHFTFSFHETYCNRNWFDFHSDMIGRLKWSRTTCLTICSLAYVNTKHSGRPIYLKIIRNNE